MGNYTYKPRLNQTLFLMTINHLMPPGYWASFTLLRRNRLSVRGLWLRRQYEPQQHE